MLLSLHYSCWFSDVNTAKTASYFNEKSKVNEAINSRNGTVIQQ